ncbi:alkaline phosphatase family protein [Nocardioides sp.]|uniref:alkaline phosphatase family protein n=1 Tax=Nocardioides sp. TaxID=35761 RepID=UPI0026029A3E|nr:alkaline phosphatase family protein [Nocardioides sp.]
MRHGPEVRERRLAELRASRRTVLTAASGLAFSSAVAATAGSAAAGEAGRVKGAEDLRCYVLVVDGCRPDEIDSGLTPNLRALREQGMYWPRATSMPVMETIPNHVMMMTGVRPDRSGVPANAIYDRELGEVRTMDLPSDIKVPTVIERLNRRGLTTGTVLSKEYLVGIFGERATHRWEPELYIPVSEHAPDLLTYNALTSMVDELDPHLVFVNLGDIDRVGHTDITGTTLRVMRQAALLQTDTLVGQFIDSLKSSGRWEKSIVIVLADHSMDWSVPTNVISLQAPLEADPLLEGKFVIGDNGGADLVYWTGPARERERAIVRIREIAESTPGVLKAWDRRAPWLRLGPEAGDVVVFCQAGWRFSDPDPVTSNPIPGNHGHPATRAIPFFIGGGHPVVKAGKVSPKHARTVDVAPTIADFFGLRTGKRAYDGKSRL